MDLYDYLDFDNKELHKMNYSKEDLQKILNFLIDLGSLYVLENTEEKLKALTPFPEEEIKKIWFYRAILYRFKSNALNPSLRKEEVEKLLKNYADLDYYLKKEYPIRTTEELEELYTNYYKELKKPINPELYKAIEKEVKSIEKLILTEKKEVKQLAESYLEEFLRSFYSLNLKPEDLEKITSLSYLKEELKNYRIQRLNTNFLGYIKPEAIQEITEEEIFIISNLDPFKYHDFQENICKILEKEPIQLKAKLQFYYNAKEKYKKLKHQKSTNDSISYI
ncbi:MAG: hypothetical protein QXR30_03370 [Candidatus Woesearchaeota archaeon]